MSGEDVEPRRHQVAEIPPFKLHVTEYCLHRLACPHCHTRRLAFARSQFNLHKCAKVEARAWLVFLETVFSAT
ncbi:IS66 family transposase zinc-finger binding domain-containing protein, partial [bacterium]|nr:IS66 family transposase zinc-finger binding domain-containing protein [bacterium]